MAYHSLVRRGWLAHVSAKLRKGIRIAAVLGSLMIASVSSASVVYLSIPTPLVAATKAKYPGNCVAFLRSDMGIKLPNVDLTTWAAKRGIRNVTGTPKYGDVAIIAVPSGTWSSYGHLAMVYSVTSTSITILEAHFSGNTVTMRQATGKSLADAEGQLNIYGYYRPR